MAALAKGLVFQCNDFRMKNLEAQCWTLDTLHVAGVGYSFTDELSGKSDVPTMFVHDE